MASLQAAKQQLRLAMKQKLGAVSHDSVISQSMKSPPSTMQRETAKDVG